jgi:hypothetical protein
MRLRSFVLPVAVAVATAVAVPAPAQAAASQCALIMPTKVVINAAEVDTDMTLTTGCYTNEADHASWDYTHTGAGYGGLISFTAAEIAQTPNWSITWDDFQPMGNYYLTPDECKTADGTDLTQNSAVTKVKYGSQFSAMGIRRETAKLTLYSTVTQWSGKSHKTVGRPGVPVALQFKATGSSTWSYVKATTASSTGKVTMAIASPKSGSYRLMVAETNTVWAAYSSAVAGRQV